MLCKSCGQSISQLEKSCPRCGMSVKNETDSLCNIQDTHERKDLKEKKKVVDNNQSKELLLITKANRRRNQREYIYENKIPGSGFFGFLGTLGMAMEPILQKMLHLQKINFYLYIIAIVLYSFLSVLIGLLASLKGGFLGLLAGIIMFFLVYTIQKVIFRSVCNESKVKISRKNFVMRILLVIIVNIICISISGYRRLIPALISFLFQICFVNALFYPVIPRGNERKFFVHHLGICIMISIIGLVTTTALTSCIARMMIRGWY